MNTVETRYAVIEIMDRTIVAEISGTRSDKLVRTQRTKVTDYRASTPVSDWDKLSTTPEEARKKWIALHERRLATAKSLVEQREDFLNMEKANVANYPVKTIR